VKRAKKYRLDELLVIRGLCESRSRAKALIMAGKVKHETTILDKPGKEYPEDLELTLTEPPKYVSRGGEKLDGFLKSHPIPISGSLVLDIGASTGGFTDCLLQKGAIHSTCVDVGHGQLHYQLQKDERVTNLEKVHAKELSPQKLPHPQYDIIVMDLSFISITKIIPVIWPFLKPGGHLIALVKPQFEASKKEADRFKGVISDLRTRNSIVQEVIEFIQNNIQEAKLYGQCNSPIRGAKGNLEELAGWTKLDNRLSN